ncbi:MAG: hypothetical protein AAGE01_22820 [Pseudomonadota bacterium]
MSTYSFESFTALEGAPATIRDASGQSCSATVVEVTKLHDSEDADAVQFSVVWRAPADANFGQGLCEVTAGGETLTLFLVPVGQEKDGLLLEAVFA